MGRSPYAEFRFACTLLRTNLQELQAVRSLDFHRSPSLWCFESQSGRGFGGQAYPAPAEALASLLAATAPSPARQPSTPSAPSTPHSATDGDSAVSWGELDLALASPEPAAAAGEAETEVTARLAEHTSTIQILQEKLGVLEAAVESAQAAQAEAESRAAADAARESAQRERAEAARGASEEAAEGLRLSCAQLERDKALFIDAHAVLKQRLATAEERTAEKQQELEASQEASAALCAEVDRLRASVEELVQQSAMVSGVAHAAAAERPRRSSSRGLESETTHLTMRPAEALPDVGEPAGAAAPVRRSPCPLPVLALTPCLCCS